MDNFQFRNPVKIIFGKNTIPKIGEEVEKRGIRRILLLAGGGSIKRNGVYQTAAASLKSYKIEVIECWGVSPNPVLSHALKAVDIAMESGAEAVLAVGGGSVIDEAKAVAVGVYMRDLWAAYSENAKIQNALPVFSILTLSGTCSEMDPLAVLTNEETKEKLPIRSPYIYPKVSIIDPEAQMTLPWNQTVNGAIDATSHTLEFYFTAKNQEITLALDESIMRTIVKSVDSLAKDDRDYDARASLAWCATLALNGFSSAGLTGGDWACHRIEHGISGYLPEVAHGAGLGVIFPAWIEYCSDANAETFQRWAREVWSCDSIEKAVRAMKEKFRSWGAPIRLSELGVEENDFAEIARLAVAGGKIGAIKKLGEKEVLDILQIAK